MRQPGVRARRARVTERMQVALVADLDYWPQEFPGSGVRLKYYSNPISTR